MTRLATALLTALALLLAAAPAVALACEQNTGRDDSTATLDQEQDQAGAADSTATASTSHPCVVSSRSAGSERHTKAEGVPTYYTDPLGTSVWSDIKLTTGYMIDNPGETLGIAGENLVGVVGGTAVNAYETAVGIGQMCMAGSPSPMPGGQCINGMVNATGQQIKDVYDSCNTTTRGHDALGTAQCFGNTAWSASQRYAAECMSDLATSGYAAGSGCVGDFTLMAGGTAGGLALRGGRGAAAANGGSSGNHIVLGLRDHGLEDLANGVGGRHLLDDPDWMSTLQSAIADPNARFTVSLDGFDGDGTINQVLGAAQRGVTPAARATEWEMAQLQQAGRLGDVTFVRNGQVVSNPWR